MEMTIHIALETPAGFHLGQAVGELAGQVCSVPSGARFSLLFTKSPSPSGTATSAQVCECKPTSYLRMLPPGSHCHSGCLPWLVLRKYQKSLEGLSTCPGSTGATGIKRQN